MTIKFIHFTCFNYFVDIYIFECFIVNIICIDLFISFTVSTKLSKVLEKN